MREAASKIEQDAAQWVARLDREGESDALRREMRAWADEDERRRGALLRAEAGWMMLNKAAVLGANASEVAPEPEAVCWDDEAGDRAAVMAGAPMAGARRRWWMGGVAMAAAAGLALVMMPMLSAAPVQEIETALGEIRRVPLADGSFAAVNTDSKVEVALKHEQRQVTLARGEAWFQVAKDTERPFVVEAGEVRVRAVGTAFSVQRHDDAVDVRVTEGVVEVWHVGDEANVRRIAAGGQISVAGSRKAVLATAAAELEPMERALSWRDGQLIFDGDTVEEAAEKFNRYNIVKIEISNDLVRHKKMIGRFRTNDPQSFARSVSALLDAKVDVKEDLIIIS